MQRILPLTAVHFPWPQPRQDLSRRIAPPYDVLDERPKQALLAGDPHNIVAIDLPYTPPKVVGPDAVYEQAGHTYRDWLQQGILVRDSTPSMVVYQQTYTHKGKTFARRGLIAGVAVQPFGKSPMSQGGIWPHEKTFSGGTEDRLKLMRATDAQLSPIFGLYNDATGEAARLLDKVVTASPPTAVARTTNDNVQHELWQVTDTATLDAFSTTLHDSDIFIADGHHRYTTAINYCRESTGQEHKPDQPAGVCMFVLIAMDDPGMIVLPTHRVLGGLKDFSLTRLTEAATDKLRIEACTGSLDQLEAAVRQAESAGGGEVHAMGLYALDSGKPAMAIATTRHPDPLAERFPEASDAWRELDVAILQHLLVEQLLEPTFCAKGKSVTWKFPHEVSVLKDLVDSGDFQLGVVMQPTPLDSVRRVSEAGELMPQKSTFFYPKLATGLVINPLR